jgi:hypothetical protein
MKKLVFVAVILAAVLGVGGYAYVTRLGPTWITQVLASQGVSMSPATQGYSFYGETNNATGMFSPSDGVLDLYTSGTKAMEFSGGNAFATSSLQVGVGSPYNAMNALSIAPGSTVPDRRGITFNSDPQGDITVWLNSLQYSAGLYVKDGNTGNTWGSVTSTGWNGAIQATGGSLSGTYSGNPTFTGNPSFTGAPSFAGAALNGSYGGNPTFTGTATFSNTIQGSISGTASALQNATPCTTGQISRGIQTNGNAICGATVQQIVNGAGCTTNGGSSYSTCTSTLYWPAAFVDANYSVSCQGIGPSDPRMQLVGVQTKTAYYVVVLATETGSGGPYSFANFDCIGVHP